MDEQGEMLTEEVVELIRPYCDFDIQGIVEQKLKSKANQLMQRKRDEKGIRKYFAVKDKEKYINIEVTGNIRDLAEVGEQLEKQIDGLMASYQKVQLEKQKLFSAQPLYHHGE